MRKLLTCLLLITASISLFAAPPAPMSPARLVNDFAGLFTPEQTRVLEDSLVAFDRATSTQIVVVTLPDLNNTAPSQMAFDIMNSWGVGQKQKNNGVVILIKPRNDTRGEVFIATGLGLEGVLPDGKVTRIIDNEMIRHLKAGDYFAAADAGAAAIRAVSRGEYNAEDEKFPIGAIVTMFVGLFMIFIFFVMAQKKNKNGGGNDSNSSGGGGGVFFPPIFGGFGGGGSSSGGGGFGGFGGGGSFGGGGGRSF